MEREKKEREEGKTKRADWMDWVVVAAAAGLSPLFLFPKIEYTPVFLIFPALFILRHVKQGEFLSTTVIDFGIGLFTRNDILLSSRSHTASRGAKRS